MIILKKITSTQGSEGSVPGSPAGQAAFGSLGRDKARAVARTIAQVYMTHCQMFQKVESDLPAKI